jgi:hypothetical protein
VLLAATAVALTWANSPWQSAYRRLWETAAGPLDLRSIATARKWRGGASPWPPTSPSPSVPLPSSAGACPPRCGSSSFRGVSPVCLGQRRCGALGRRPRGGRPVPGDLGSDPRAGGGQAAGHRHLFLARLPVAPGRPARRRELGPTGGRRHAGRNRFHHLALRRRSRFRPTWSGGGGEGGDPRRFAGGLLAGSALLLVSSRGRRRRRRRKPSRSSRRPPPPGRCAAGWRCAGSGPSA